MSDSPNRRKKAQVSDEALYKLPKRAIHEFINKERRHDELGRLREVRAQKRIWTTTVLIGILMNAVLLALAIYGWALNGFT